MGDAPNELEVLEARREILQLEIALAQERRAAAEAGDLLLVLISVCVKDDLHWQYWPPLKP